MPAGLPAPGATTLRITLAVASLPTSTGLGVAAIARAVVAGLTNKFSAVEVEGEYGVEKDKYNAVIFKPVTTTAVRLEVNFQKPFSAGVERWSVK